MNKVKSFTSGAAVLAFAGVAGNMAVEVCQYLHITIKPRNKPRQL